MDKNVKKKNGDKTLNKKGRKKKTSNFYGKLEHMEKNCWKNTKDLEKKVKNFRKID